MTATEIVNKMMENDAFSQWLGIQVEEIKPGFAKLSMTTRQEMTNGFGIIHGGISYALADSCLAFAANGHGIQSVSIETSISHTKPIKPQEKITAKALQKNLTKRIGIYEIIIQNEKEETVALFKGTVYRTGKEWE
ncbi:MAG: hotdog fold thioesterase [Flavobacteriales bacterium]|jgi:acyl-CoA thioesterase|nr:hotdog fold thioesterase [Flavobacteriales bacterium]